MIVFLQNTIKVRRMFNHEPRLIEELLCGDGKKFRFTNRAVSIEERFFAIFGVVFETQIFTRTC